MENIANGGEEEFQRSGGAEGSPVRSAGRDYEPVELREQELDRGKTHAGAGTSAEPDASSREQRENREATGAPIKQTTCGDGDLAKPGPPVLNTRPSASKGSKGPLVCQVQGCNRDLSQEKKYYKRYRVCMGHLKMEAICVDGRLQRFCQQCGRFHDLSSFDGDRRNCRDRLNQHNRRRRKSKHAAMGGAAGSDGSWDDSGSLSPMTGRIVKGPRGPRIRRQIQFALQRRYPGNMWLYDDANGESTEEAELKDITMVDASQGRTFRGSGRHLREPTLVGPDSCPGFGNPSVSGFQRSQVQVGGARSAFKQLEKSQNGQPLQGASGVDRELKSDAGAGIDYQVVLDQIVPAEVDGRATNMDGINSSMRTRSNDMNRGLKQLDVSVCSGLAADSRFSSIDSSQTGIGASKGSQGAVAAVPVIFVPVASAAQIVPGLQLGNNGTVALIPTNDSNAVQLGGSGVVLATQPGQAGTSLSTVPVSSAVPVTSHVSAAVPSSSCVVPISPIIRKLHSESGTQTEGMARASPQAPFVALTMQPGTPKGQLVLQSSLASAVQGTPIATSHIADLKRVVAQEAQTNQIATLPTQLLVAPQSPRLGGDRGFTAGAVRPVTGVGASAAGSGGMEASCSRSNQHLVQSAVNISQRAQLVVDNNTGTCKLMTVYPGETVNFHVNHAQ